MTAHLIEIERPPYLLSTAPSRLQIDVIFHFLSQESYWAQNRTLDILQKSIENSLCFGIYHETQQVAFARVVTDFATFGWVCDVFVLTAYRGQGLGKFLIEGITTHPELCGIRRLMLATRDAHGLYRQYGFTPLTTPERWMDRINPS